MGQADLDLLPANHDCPGHGDRNFVRTARSYHTTEIQIGPHTITAADPCRTTYTTPSKRSLGSLTCALTGNDHSLEGSNQPPRAAPRPPGYRPAWGNTVSAGDTSGGDR
jgi:hypothetical protein